MIGGGPGSFIGAVHRIAARMDGDYELVAGAFSSKPEKCLETARELGIAEERAYPSWAEMLESESALPADERVQVIMITTPNHVHAAPTIAALEGWFSCDFRQALVHFHGRSAGNGSGREKFKSTVLLDAYLHGLSYD